MTRLFTVSVLCILWSFAAFPTAAEEPFRGFSYGESFEGPALQLKCIAILKKTGEAGLVKAFRDKTEGERRICLHQLLVSITPSPDFTMEDVTRSLKEISPGQYELLPTDQTLAKRMGNRIGVNDYVARGIAELAHEHLIDDPSVFSGLIACLDHPVHDVGLYCNRALAWLTHHGYGGQFWERSAGAKETVQEHQRLIDDWKEYARLMAHGRPIFDKNLEKECLSTINALSHGLLVAHKRFGENLPYVSESASRLNLPLPPGEILYSLDVNQQNDQMAWGTKYTKGFALMIDRPGISNASSMSNDLGYLRANQSLIKASDFHETFPALDLEVWFGIETSNDELRHTSIVAVHDALERLRVLNAKTAATL